MIYTSSNLTFFFCDIASHVFLQVHKFNLQMSHQPPSLLDTCQLFVLLVRVFSASLFQSEESPWEVSVNRVCKTIDIQSYPFL